MEIAFLLELILFWSIHFYFYRWSRWMNCHSSPSSPASLHLQKPRQSTSLQLHLPCPTSCYPFAWPISVPSPAPSLYFCPEIDRFDSVSFFESFHRRRVCEAGSCLVIKSEPSCFDFCCMVSDFWDRIELFLGVFYFEPLLFPNFFDESSDS